MDGTNHTSTAGERRVDKSRPISGAALMLPEECIEAYTNMKLRRRHKYIVFMVGDESIVPEKLAEKTGTLDEFKAALPYTDCRYCLYDHAYTSADGRPQSKIYFVIWLPQNATPYSKMAYAAAKPLFDQKMEGVYTVQVSSLAELDTALGVEEEEENNEFNEDDF